MSMPLELSRWRDVVRGIVYYCVHCLGLSVLHCMRLLGGSRMPMWRGSAFWLEGFCRVYGRVGSKQWSKVRQNEPWYHLNLQLSLTNSH